jgi:thioredoxin-related protein
MLNKLHTFALLTLSTLTLSLALSQDTVKVKEPIFGRYNEKADPETQLRDAISAAQKSNKRILMEVGGEWCKWCHYLDTFFENNQDITAFLQKNFILIKINFSKANDNELFLKKFPPVAGYPHIFVLDKNGTLIHSQDTGLLEKGQGHDREKMMQFLVQWAGQQ